MTQISPHTGVVCRARPSVRRPLAVAAGCGAAAAWVGWHDPVRRPGLFVPCPMRTVTGLRCPACGGTRMAHHLMRGRLLAAFRENPVLLVFGLPLLAWLWARWFAAARQGRYPEPVPRRIGYAALLIAGSWMVVRNVAARRPRRRRGRH